MRKATQILAQPFVVAVGLLAMPCSALLAGAATEAGMTLRPRFGVRTVKDIAYVDSPDADPVKHKLDLYLPKDQKDFPVVFFVHGGAWQRGDKTGHLGVYAGLARFLAKHGVGVVVPNYRLSPAVKHPEHIKDVARAFAWTCKNIGKYGGDTSRLFASGHSAGAHLVSLLVTDETHLKDHGLSLRNVAGVISVSGVYYLPDELFPSVFGTNPMLRQTAWPLKLIKAGLPPFLVLYADKDLPGCDREPAEKFCKALKDKGNEVKLMEASDSNHYKILFSMALADDPVANAILLFLQTHAFSKP